MDARAAECRCRMPVLDGIEAPRRLCDMGARARVLMLTIYGLDEHAAGEALLAPEITRRLINGFVSGARPNTSPPALEELTEREREILDLMRHGRKNKEIAGELCIAESTVHKHVQNIFEKLHARNRAEAIFLTGLDAFVESTTPLESDTAAPSSDQEVPEVLQEEANLDTAQEDHDPLSLQ